VFTHNILSILKDWKNQWNFKLTRGVTLDTRTNYYLWVKVMVHFNHLFILVDIECTLHTILLCCNVNEYLIYHQLFLLSWSWIVALGRFTFFYYFSLFFHQVGAAAGLKPTILGQWYKFSTTALPPRTKNTYFNFVYQIITQYSKQKSPLNSLENSVLTSLNLFAILQCWNVKNIHLSSVSLSVFERNGH